MSREEAIEILKQFKKCLSDVVFDEKGSEAWQMGIQALSQEPCDVSVSEKEPNEITEEVTLRFFKNSLKVKWHNFVIYNVEWLKKNWQMEMDIVCGVKPCDDAVSRILKRMWNCRGKHTTSIDKVAMEQIIRDELFSVTPKPIECDDAISRKDVEECKELMTDINGETVFAVRMSDIRALPSVTPSRRKGHWLKTGQSFLNPNKFRNFCCTECLHELEEHIRKEPKYCPNCGAKMESEDKE